MSERLKFLSSRSERDFEVLGQKFKERYDKNELHIMICQLQETKQKADKFFKKCAERIEKNIHL